MAKENRNSPTETNGGAFASKKASGEATAKSRLDDSALSNWLLGGVGITVAAASLVGLTGTAVQRVTNSHQAWFLTGVWAVLFAVGCAAVMLVLKSIDRFYVFRLCAAVAGVCSLLFGTGTLVVLHAMTVSQQDVSTMALSLSSGDETKVKISIEFKSTGLEPGQFLIVDILGLPNADPNQIGERIYRGALGADSAGAVDSEVETQVSRDKFAIVVAEVYPGPAPDTTAGNRDELTGYTRLCSDVEESTPRSCAYARVPQE